MKKIYCACCDYDKPIKGEKTNYKYEESGLDNITIANATVYTCPQCGEQFVDFGNVDEINNVISRFLAHQKELLTGPQVRFIRTHLGFSSKMFANEVLKVRYETLSKVENGKIKISPPMDQLVKFLAFGNQKDRNYDIHDMILNRISAPKRILITHVGNKYEAKAA